MDVLGLEVLVRVCLEFQDGRPLVQWSNRGDELAAAGHASVLPGRCGMTDGEGLPPLLVTPQALSVAARAGNLPLLRQLLAHARTRKESWGEAPTQEAADAAADAGFVNVLRFLKGCRDGQEDEGAELLPSLSGLLAAARNGDMEVLQFCHESGVVFVSTVLTEAAMHGRTTAVHWLVRHVGLPPTEDAIDFAIKHEHYDLAKWLCEQESGDATFSRRGCDFAAANGNLPFVEWLHARGGIFKAVAMDKCSKNGHLAVVRYLHETCNCRVQASAMTLAAANGALAVVEYHHNVTQAGCEVNAATLAAANGHLRTLQWLLENRLDLHLTSEAFDAAAANNHESVIRFLHDTPLPNGAMAHGTTDAMDRAAENGHIAMVEWLHRHREEGATIQAMDFAAREGHLRVVEWLHRNRTEGCAPRALDLAAQRGHIKIVEWLLDNREEGGTHYALDWAAGNGHLHVCELLKRRRSDLGVSEASCELAAARGHVDALAWLRTHHPEVGNTTESLDMAARHGHLDCCVWLHEHGAGASKDAIAWALRNGHLDCANWLHQNRDDGVPGHTLGWVVSNNQPRSVLWMLQHGLASLASVTHFARLQEMDGLLQWIQGTFKPTPTTQKLLVSPPRNSAATTSGSEADETRSRSRPRKGWAMVI